MKLLVAYDGSKCSEAALDDLSFAGLPGHAEALVITVAEAWLPTRDRSVRTREAAAGIEVRPRPEAIFNQPTSKRLLSEADTLVKHAKQRLQAIFPNWQIKTRATYGSPAREILSTADNFEPNLVIVGAQGHSTKGPFFPGSISQKVLTEAFCSVRVSRERKEKASDQYRIIIGFDGSPGSRTAVAAVEAREWPEFAEIRLVAATEQITPPSIGRFLQPKPQVTTEVNSFEHEHLSAMVSTAIEGFRSKNIDAKLEVFSGNPKDILVNEADRWNADCIFVGAVALGGSTERCLLGSTSAAVAARATCSVEVIRDQDRVY